MKELNRCCFLLLLFLLCSCKNNERPNSDKEDAIRDRYFRLQNIGWKSKTYSQKVDDINFTAIEVPIQYYLLRNSKTTDLTTVDSLYEENKKEKVIEPA